MRKAILALFIVFTVVGLAAQTRLKDISKISGMDSRQLIGYGLVTGLQGTGDTAASQVTIQSINNMLEHFGLSVPENRVRPNNTAAVMVTAILPPFASPGSHFDVIISSVGDARSLEGGQLLMTPLVDQDNRKYALAQGPISFGGFNEERRGSSARKNYTNTGRIPGGGMVELENSNMIFQNGELKILLNQPDFTTAERATEAINIFFDVRLATAENASTITVIVPDDVIMGNNLINFISNIENLEIMPQQIARVVINERTGTIVAGGNVRIAPVAIAHGNLIIRVAAEDEVYAAGQFSLERYITIMDSREETRVFFMETATIQELAQALNAIKVSPRDMISIFQLLKESGALFAELRIL
ncbi:MAG: flagellar basal body P-ring protein FlgI [Candidatus Cloacimonetes bacterium]|nr:flagellar basal body P-ring protein FlgI [Candidatus Cloacimonadota bacterium]